MMLVSVCMITYNHENYIRQAIDGVLMQDVDFELELLVSNDCSKDNTHDVITQIIKEHPKGHLIKYVNHNPNIGMMSNFIGTLKQCQGDYIAICEGDDYWTDPKKLKKQVAVLKAHEDCRICFTNNSKLMPDGTLLSNPNPIETTTGFIDLIQKNYIATLTVMFRNLDMSDIPDYFNTFKIGDWPLYLWLINKTKEKVYYLDQNTAVYRAGVGVSNNIRRYALKEFDILEQILQSFFKDSQFSDNKKLINTAICDMKERKMGFYNRNGSYFNGLKLFSHLLLTKPSIMTIKLYLYSLKKK